MAIQILKRPYDRNWSGNPISYTLFSAAAEAENTNYFEIKIKFKRLDAVAYSDALTLPYKPVTGTAKIDIQDILDGLLVYELPMMPEADEWQSILLAKKMTGHFYIEYREITIAAPDPDWETDVENPFFIIKGGISFHKWRGDNYWVNYFDVKLPFLTWQESGRQHSLTERMYLAWLNLTDVAVTAMKMQLTVRFTDGSENVSLLDCAVPLKNVCYFPSGAAQLEIESIDVNKTIYYWELQVIKQSTNPNEPITDRKSVV